MIKMIMVVIIIQIIMFIQRLTCHACLVTLVQRCPAFGHPTLGVPKLLLNQKSRVFMLHEFCTAPIFWPNVKDNNSLYDDAKHFNFFNYVQYDLNI